MRPGRVFLLAAAAVAAAGALEALLAPDAPTVAGPTPLVGPDGPMNARPIGGWCPSPPAAFRPCDGGPDSVRIRAAAPADAALLSPDAGPAAPWRRDGWAARAAALGIPPDLGDAPDADLATEALAAARHLPASSFLAAVPAGGVPGLRRATLDVARPDSGPTPWRLLLVETRLHAGRAWTLQAEVWSQDPPDAARLQRARQGIEAAIAGIEAPPAPDPARLLWAQVAQPDGPEAGAGRAHPRGSGWRLDGPLPDAPDAERLAEEAAPLRREIEAAAMAGMAHDGLVLAFAHAAVRAALGPPVPAWAPAPAACGRGLALGEGRHACLLPDGRMAMAQDLHDGGRDVRPLARADDLSAHARPAPEPR
jgi:hypothetical protein